MALRAILMASVAAMALTGCTDTDFFREVGSEVDEGGFGNATMNNTMLMTGQIEATVALGRRFANEVPTTINFAFNSSQLSDAARATLREQAKWIRQFPEVRFRVYGHTDLVGSEAYNKALGLRRANAAVAFLVGQGIGSARLEAVVSFGKTRPVIQTPGPEERNRRTVTEVVGFVQDNPMVLNGKYAEIIMREYVKSGKREHPTNTTVGTEVDPSQ
ncbi:MAG: OmpA family protein [Rhodobacteraceae bacterium]|uniref:OmpA family protein n=1 Tax=Tabrizicola sp. SY72 TaxID=2741673 RepID=UPI001574CD3D|nr:OmpA family protein [Tabrizicola sp. SY72]MBL9054910.1 OmpA family protein [Paracoccaceae bacterium]NTT87238.1 OmpA family protein [Tabrizicola sp. SY72]